MALSGWSTTPGSNATVGSIDWAEGMAPANVNNSARQLMADFADWYRNGAEWIARADSATYVSGTSFKFVGSNKTSVYSVGRRIKLVASTPGTLYGRITASSFSTDTTVTVSWDSTAVLANEAITSVAPSIFKGGTSAQSIDISGIDRVSTFSATTLGSTSAAAWRTALSAQQNVITTRGDIVKGSTAAVAQRLAIGAANTFLKSDGSDPSWSSLPTASTGTAGIIKTANAATVLTGTSTAATPLVSTMKSHQGVVKAWASFNGTGSAALRDSYNVTSLTDNGTGDYTINLSITMGNASFAVAAGGLRSVANKADTQVSAYAASTTTVGVFGGQGTGALADCEWGHCMVIGDL